MALQGRNEQCGCGSGKKFKKCCGHFTQEGHKQTDAPSFSSSLSEFFKLLSERAKTDELGQPLKAQAAELLQGGWAGIGYLMVSPPGDGGVPFGRKKAAYSQADAAELNQWFDELTARKFLAGWRFYIAPKPRISMVNSEFKGRIVHRATYGSREVIVEFVPASLDIPATLLDGVAKELSSGVRVAEVAREFAMFSEMAAMGTKITTYNSGD